MNRDDIIQAVQDTASHIEALRAIWGKSHIDIDTLGAVRVQVFDAEAKAAAVENAQITRIAYDSKHHHWQIDNTTIIACTDWPEE
jgi:hypothetical protein